MEDNSRSRVMYDTWFSSCGHFERVTATVGVWSNDTTYKPYWRKRNSWFFYKESVLLFPLSTVYDFRQHTSSKEINVSPSRNLYSENAENQATFRNSDHCNDIRSFFNVSSNQILEKIWRHFQRESLPRAQANKAESSLAIAEPSRVLDAKEEEKRKKWYRR